MRLRRKTEVGWIVEERNTSKPLETLSEPKKPKKLWGPLSEEIEKDKPRWTYLVPPVATLIGTLVTFLGTTATIIILALTFNQNSDKNRVERKENTIRRLETEFSEVQTRLSNSDPQTRAVAVLQLADLAQTSLPAEALTPAEEKAGYKITDFSRTHYSFFLRAVRQYATILPMEKDASVRAVTKDALLLLVTFLRKYLPLWEVVRSPDPQSPKTALVPAPALPLKALLAPEYAGEFYEKREESGKTERVPYDITEADVVLAEMTNELADANRKAKDNFMRAFANYKKKTNPKTRKYLPGFVYSLVGALGLDAAPKRSGEILFDNKQNATIEQSASDAALADALESEARKLVDTRDTLATALSGYADSVQKDLHKYLALPKGFPTKALIAAPDDIKTITRDIAFWERKPALILKECLLVDANLRGVQLQGVNLSNAHLQGADLVNTCLQKADFRAANLQTADLRWGQLQGAAFNWAELQATDLSEAQLRGANLSETVFDSATCLYGIYVQQTDDIEYSQTKFGGTNWQEENFKPRQNYPKSQEVDKRTQNAVAWLKAKFPPKETR